MAKKKWLIIVLVFLLTVPLVPTHALAYSDDSGFIPQLTQDQSGGETPEEPGSEESGTEEPGLEEPGSEEPGTEEPGSEEPGLEEPGLEEPGLEEPGSEEPGTEEPGEEPEPPVFVCEALFYFNYPDTNITEIKLVPAEDGLPEHCLVRGKMHERKSPVDNQTYAIGFEMRLPAEWSGRFLYQANGGIDGTVAPAYGGIGSGPNALQRGFAVISSDAGHTGSQNPTFGRDPQARLDYGYQAVGKLTPMAKALIKAAYGREPDYSYIAGGSNGGRHTMVAAARYADQYDGFLAISPGFNLSQAAVAQLWGAQQWAKVATGNNLNTALTKEERQTIANAILARCDELDGLEDGIVYDFKRCQKEFKIERDVPTCENGRDGTCLTEEQKRVIQTVFDGAKKSNGERIYTSFPFDPGIVSDGWSLWKFSISLFLDPGAVAFIFLTPPEDPSVLSNLAGYALSFDVDAKADLIYGKNETYTESAMEFMTPPNPTNLDTLRNRGGKMIVVHGASDGVFSPDDTTRWYDELNAAYDNKADEFVRYFYVPGMGHVSGGPATDQFDGLGAIIDWVENGKAPDRIIASVNPFNQEVPGDWSKERTRPLCPYPLIAKYVGGDPESAESFACLPSKSGGSPEEPGTGPAPTPPSSSAPSEPAPAEQIAVEGDAVTVKPDISRTQENGTIREQVSLAPADVQKALQAIEESGRDTIRVVIPDEKDEVSQVDFRITAETAKLIGDANVTLEINTENARIQIPASSLDGVEEEVYFRIMPIKEESQRKDIEERARKDQMVVSVTKGHEAQVVGRPVTIESNLENGPVTLILPLDSAELPSDPAERAAFLADLAIFIEHSDGDKELVKPRVVEYKPGVYGLQFEVSKFSTFTILRMEGWHEQYHHKAYMKGYTDGTFRPDRAITRAEMAAVLARNLGFDGTAAAASSYVDVPSTHWAAKEIEFVKRTGLMVGDGNGAFRPDALITRGEMAAIAARYKQLDTSGFTGSRFRDVDATYWGAAYIEAAKAAGIIAGYEDGTYRPNGHLTRAEAVTIINRLFGRGPLHGVSRPSWSDVPASHWAFNEIEEASRDHDYEPLSGGGERLIH